MNRCELIAAQVGEMFECSTTRRGDIRIRTPFYYPDGGVVDVFLVEQGGVPVHVTDFGEALGWLRMQSVRGKRSPKQDKLIEDVCTTHAVEFFKGEITTRVPSVDKLADCVIRVSQAAVRIADLWFTMRTRAVESMPDEVADLLDERRVKYERASRQLGHSGRDWNIDFYTQTATQSSLVLVLASGSRTSARRVTEHVAAGFMDLSHLKVRSPNMKFVSLFDDTSDVWGSEDFKLVEHVSEIARWTRPDEFLQLLAA
jgi:hypothetical protein